MEELIRLHEQLNLFSCDSKALVNIISLDEIAANADYNMLLSSFIKNYLFKILQLKKLASDSESKLFDYFLDWISTNGKEFFNKVLNNKNCDPDTEVVKDFLVSYDCLLESCYENRDFNGLKNFLYEVPKKIYKDFKALGYIEERICFENNEYNNMEKAPVVPKETSISMNNNLEYNFSIEKDLQMQVYFLLNV